MTTTNIIYNGELRCTATHTQSGSVIETDAPLDNHGRGECFSPTDLVGAALGTCMLTLMGIAARKLGITIDGARSTVEKEMSPTPPRRIGVLKINIHVPGNISAEHRAKLETAALTCPVHHSLHPDIRMDVGFHWG